MLSFPERVAFARSSPIINSPRDIHINQKEYLKYIVFVPKSKGLPGYWRCVLDNFVDPRPFSLLYCSNASHKYTLQHHKVCKFEPYRKELCEYYLYTS